MCGIVGYVGDREALPILVKGLKALEYRGYDSAGVAIIGDEKAFVVKRSGAVAVLEEALKKEKIRGTTGIAHTRWATHGPPTEVNAHPHLDCEQRIAVVHNGIIENFKELKDVLVMRGHAFRSDTDTEVVAHLIEEGIKGGKSFRDALYETLRTIRGAYALVVADSERPGIIYATRVSSPLVIGVGEGEHIVASDPSALLEITKNVIYLKDGDVAEIDKGRLTITDLAEKPQFSEVTRIEWTLEQAQKGAFPHFMLKEIMEEADAVRNTLRGRLLVEEGLAKLGGLESVAKKLEAIKRMIIIACGTASYASLVGEYMIEANAGIPVEVDIGSEFRYRKPVIDTGTATLAVSQSGETADTLEAIREGKRQKAISLGIVNVVGSSIARETEAGIYLHAGPEISVASTKAYLCQLTALALLTLFLGRQRTMGKERGREIARALQAIPEKIEKIFAQKDHIRHVAEKYAHHENFLFIGRKYNYATALEGSLKLKETTYIHAEACGAGEMKHGHLAIINEKFPTCAIAPSDDVYEKMISNIQEVKARKGPIIAVATEGNEDIRSLVDDIFYIPPTLDMLSPILAAVPLHLFAYYIGARRGINVDRPRNLAKSVTVE